MFVLLKNIADKYQIPFINYNNDEAYGRIGLYYGNDMGDADYSNYLGNVKYTMV